MEVGIEAEIRDVNMGSVETRRVNLSNVLRRAQPPWVIRVIRTGLSIFMIALLPENVKSSDYECGINRFNNESPLTERIVGGNNSLQ